MVDGAFYLFCDSRQTVCFLACAILVPTVQIEGVVQTKSAELSYFLFWTLVCPRLYSDWWNHTGLSRINGSAMSKRKAKFLALGLMVTDQINWQAVINVSQASEIKNEPSGVVSFVRFLCLSHLKQVLFCVYKFAVLYSLSGLRNLLILELFHDRRHQGEV